MDERSRQSIRKYLQREEVQERVQQNMYRGRSEATVTIGRAARIFGFTENQLRDWEDRDLLKPLRPTGQRQYTPDELNKLAIIHELINEGGYTPGEIPSDIDHIWRAISPVGQTKQQGQMLKARGDEAKHLHIEQRVERDNGEVFWRYFISQVLRLSIMLICEDIPETLAGLVLPLQKLDTPVRHPNDLPMIGDCLVGWLERSGYFYTFLDSHPSFEFPSDFRIQPLAVTVEDVIQEAPQDNTFIIVQRKAKPLNLSSSLVKTLRQLLNFIYTNLNDWHPHFDYGMRDWVYQVTDFMSSPNASDEILNSLADMIIRLGGKTPAGVDRWHFCSILLPQDPTLPLQQHSLVIRAQSRYAPHDQAMTMVTTKDPGLSLSAYQSGHSIYRPDTSVKDFMFADPEHEASTRSALAIPIAGEDGLSIAVLYVASNETNAFPEDAQRVLRIMSKMVEELLMTYRARQQLLGKFSDLIVNPSIVDTTFKDFLSENEFLYDLEVLLATIKGQMPEWQEPVRKEEVSLAEQEARFRAGQLTGEVVSFIAIDIDNQSGLATKYGNRVTRNLSQAVGLRIKGQLTSFEKYSNCPLYHIFADRFYLLLKGIPLDEVQIKAEQLRQTLKGSYLIHARRNSIERPVLPVNMLELTDITVRVGVSSYSYAKLTELLQRYPAATAVAKVRELVINSINEALDVGLHLGGDVVISWEPGKWGYVRWSPPT